MTTRLDKPVARELAFSIRHLGAQGATIVTISRAGISFREKGRRHTLELTWRDVVLLAERRAGELAHQEKLRTQAVKRRSAPPPYAARAVGTTRHNGRDSRGRS